MDEQDRKITKLTRRNWPSTRNLYLPRLSQVHLPLELLSLGHQEKASPTGRNMHLILLIVLYCTDLQVGLETLDIQCVAFLESASIMRALEPT